LIVEDLVGLLLAGEDNTGAFSDDDFLDDVDLPTYTSAFPDKFSLGTVDAEPIADHALEVVQFHGASANLWRHIGVVRIN
jgi:hypothetical protein